MGKYIQKYRQTALPDLFVDKYRCEVFWILSIGPLKNHSGTSRFNYFTAVAWVHLEPQAIIFISCPLFLPKIPSVVY